MKFKNKEVVEIKTYTFNDFTINKNNENIITDKQLWISLFNSSVSNTFRQIALHEINKYIAEHKELIFDKSDDLVCILQAYMTKSLKEKFNISIFIYNEKKRLEKDCLINIPILPHESYFKDFRKLVIVELEKLIFE